MLILFCVLPYLRIALCFKGDMEKKAVLSSIVLVIECLLYTYLNPSNKKLSPVQTQPDKYYVLPSHTSSRGVMLVMYLEPVNR